MKGAQVWQKMAKTLFYNESRMFHFSTMAAHQGFANLRNDKKYLAFQYLAEFVSTILHWNNVVFEVQIRKYFNVSSRQGMVINHIKT